MESVRSEMIYNDEKVRDAAWGAVRVAAWGVREVRGDAWDKVWGVRGDVGDVRDILKWSIK